MFAGAFSGSFAGRGAAAVGAFASAFAACFAGRAAAESGGYIGPMMAQAALAGGAAWSVSGSALVVGGARLIGPAGKVYAFASAQTAEKWAINAGVIGRREAELLASIDSSVAENWKAGKRARLALVAAQLVDAALLQADSAKRAALIAESTYCLSKWACYADSAGRW